MKGGRDPEGGRRGGGPGRYREYLRYLHLGTQMALILLLGVFGGIWLDGRTGGSPLFTILGSVAGIGLGMAVVIREVNRKDS